MGCSGSRTTNRSQLDASVQLSMAFEKLQSEGARMKAEKHDVGRAIHWMRNRKLSMAFEKYHRQIDCKNVLKVWMENVIMVVRERRAIPTLVTNKEFRFVCIRCAMKCNNGFSDEKFLRKLKIEYYNTYLGHDIAYLCEQVLGLPGV